MIQYVVFGTDGVEVRRGFCQKNALDMQSREGSVAYEVNQDVFDLGPTLMLQGGEIVKFQG